MAAGEPVLYSLYVYAPSKWAPILFTALYAISAFFHIFQCFRYKTWRLIGLHPLCGVFLTVGYGMREYGAYNYKYDPDSKIALNMFIISQVFIYICPPLLELSNYHILSRVFYYVYHCAPIKPGNVMAIFGGIMGLIECLNSLGVAFSSNSSGSSSKQNLGSHLTIAAVAIQIGIILAFFCLASLFHRRCAKANVLVRSVNVMLITLYLSMSLILVRCVYRLVEHAGNTSVEYKDMKSMKKLSPIVRYEVFFYVFEASLMFLNSALWSLCNPGRFLPRNYSIYLGQDGTEVQGQKDVDTRSVPAQLVNILTFGLLCGRKRGDSYAEVTPDELEGGPESSDGHGMPVKQSNEPSTVETTIANVLTFGLWSLSQRRKKAPEAERLDEYPIAQRQ